MSLTFENEDFDEAAYRETLVDELKNLSFPELVGFRTDAIFVYDEMSLDAEEIQKGRDTVAALSSNELIEELKYTVCLFPIVGEMAADPRDSERGAIIKALQHAGVDLFIEILVVPYGFPIEPHKLRKAYIEQMLD